MHQLGSNSSISIYTAVIRVLSSCPILYPCTYFPDAALAKFLGSPSNYFCIKLEYGDGYHMICWCYTLGVGLD